MNNQVFVELDLIDPNPYQPRKSEDPDVVREIAQSIEANGLLQVPSARAVNGHYQLAFGHTRLAAYRLLAEEGKNLYTSMPLIERELNDLQMFELAVAENIKRRDLNPIEQAESMRRYMEEFGKNSVETGTFFGVSPETVRGTVRLNNLVPQAKQKLAEGKITVSTARTLLSIQKVAPEEVVIETLERLEKGVDRWGLQETPDEIIDDVLDDLDEVKELWSGHWEGKPRAGARDAWLLETKSFPNKFLPVLTPVDAAIALGIQNDEEMMEKVATWIQASLGELPDLDIETLGIPEHLEKKLCHLINPPACTACPFYSVVQENHYCGMVTCFTRKANAWQREKLQTASRELKIQIYSPETDGEFRVLEETRSDNGQKHLELFRKRSKDLRLALAVDIDRKKPQSGYQGVPSGSVVMLVGKSLKNLLETGQKVRAEKRSKEQAAALLASLLEEKREVLDWEIASHVKTLFDAMNLTALQALWETPGRYGNEWEISFYNMPKARTPKDAKDSEKADSYRRLMALNMVRKIGGYYKKSIAEYAVHASQKIKSWGVKLPKSITKLAAQMDEEIKAATETED